MQTQCVCCDVGTGCVKYFSQFYAATLSFPSTLSAFNQEDERALLGPAELQQLSTPL